MYAHRGVDKIRMRQDIDILKIEVDQSVEFANIELRFYIIPSLAETIINKISETPIFLFSSKNLNIH